MRDDAVNRGMLDAAVPAEWQQQLAPEARARLIADCEAWKSAIAADLIEHACATRDMPAIGAAFWNARQRIARMDNAAMQSAAEQFPALRVYLATDGQIWAAE